jgi:hypothetical protein
MGPAEVFVHVDEPRDQRRTVEIDGLSVRIRATPVPIRDLDDTSAVDHDIRQPIAGTARVDQQAPTQD